MCLIENFVGRADIIFFSIEPSASFWEVWKWPTAIRWGRVLDLVNYALKRLTEAEFALISERLGYAFADRNLLERALTHASGAKKRADYERLEFLGDRVLGLVIAEELYRRHPSKTEGELAANFSAFVRGDVCAAVAREASLGEHVRLGPREKPKASISASGYSAM